MSISFKTNSFWALFVILSFIVIAYGFYGYIGINPRIVTVLQVFAIMYISLFSYDFLIQKYTHLHYANLIRLILFVYLISILMSYLFWNQDLLSGIRATLHDLSILLFFFLLQNKVKNNTIEKTILLLCALYTIIWFYSITQIPNFIFGADRDGNLLDMSRGFYRLFIPGREIIPLTLFLAINKYTYSKKIIWLISAVLLFVLVILHVRRQDLFWTTVIIIYYLFLRGKNNWLYLLLFIILFLTGKNLVKLNSNSVINSLVEQTETQFENQSKGEEDIRITSIKYFTTEYNKNIITSLFGNGRPFFKSTYGTFNEQLNSKGLYKSDIGWFGMYADFGILCVILYFVLLIKVLKHPVSAEYMYAKLFIIYINGAFLLSHTLITAVVLNCLCLYILEKDFLKFTANNNNSDAIIFTKTYSTSES